MISNIHIAMSLFLALLLDIDLFVVVFNPLIYWVGKILRGAIDYHAMINLSHFYLLKDMYPNFEVGLKCILMVNPYLLVCSYIK